MNTTTPAMPRKTISQPEDPRTMIRMAAVFMIEAGVLDEIGMPESLFLRSVLLLTNNGTSSHRLCVVGCGVARRASKRERMQVIHNACSQCYLAQRARHQSVSGCRVILIWEEFTARFVEQYFFRE